MEALRTAVSRLGFATIVTSTDRPRNQQAALYHAWLRGDSRYPAAPPGHSAHEDGRAFDLGGSREALGLAGGLARYFGLRWGADYDPIHFEVP